MNRISVCSSTTNLIHSKIYLFLVNLSALVYQHTIAALALPTKLVLPTSDIAEDYRPAASQHHEAKKMSVKDLLEKGAGNFKYFSHTSFDSIRFLSFSL